MTAMNIITNGTPVTVTNGTPGTVVRHEYRRDGGLVYGVRDRYRVTRWHTAGEVFAAEAATERRIQHDFSMAHRMPVPRTTAALAAVVAVETLNSADPADLAMLTRSDLHMVMRNARYMAETYDMAPDC